MKLIEFKVALKRPFRIHQGLAKVRLYCGRNFFTGNHQNMDAGVHM